MKRLKTILTWIFLSIFLVGVGTTPISASELAEGQKHFFQSNYKTALKHFNNALEKHPNKSMIHFFIGQAHLNMKNYSDAKTSFQKALQLKPEYGLARLNLARTCHAMGDFVCAKKEYREVEENYPAELKPDDKKNMEQLANITPIPKTAAPDISSSTVALADTTPPEIIITSPQLSRGVHVVSTEGNSRSEKLFAVTGIAIEGSGILRVFVNDVVATLSDTGKFSAAIKIKPGENPVLIRATDRNGNTAKHRFNIIRPSEFTVYKANKKTREEDNKNLVSARFFALLIAVEKYNDPAINELDQPLLDAKNLAKILTEEYTFSPQHVLLLENPTRAQIVNTFYTLSRTITPADNLLIFYAGHGYWEEKFEVGYWLPSNAKKEDRAEWLSNSTIRDFIRGIKSRHTLLVADACFSGGIFKTRKAFETVTPAVRELYKLKSRKAITSGTLTEVPDKSVFANYILKRLSDNGEKYLSSQALFSKFRAAVINNSLTNQVPQYGTIHGCGDEGAILFL